MRKGFTLIELMIVIAIIAIIAAIAIPNLIESRVTANENAASASLKSGIFPAEVLFQGGVCQDTDGDNVGEYGHIADLTGGRATSGMAAGKLKYVQGPLASVASGVSLKEAQGFFFSAWTPNAGNTDMIMEGSALAAPITDNSAERNFAVTAVPARRDDTGRRIFLISHEGQVRSPSAVARVETWFVSTTNPVPTSVSVLAGLNDALNTDNILSDGFVNASYPFYSK